MIVKSKHNGFTRDGVRRVYMGGGGGGQTSTSYQTNIPEYAQKPYMDLVGRASALYDAPYQPYTGERQAQFTPLQQQAFEGAGNLGPAQQIGMGTQMAGMGAGRSFGQPGTSQQFMSPYMQNVVDIQQREAVRQNQIANQSQAAQAVGRGAFGGSRDALLQAESARNLGTQLGDIQAKGLQSAYDQAQQQFNAEQNRLLQGAGIMGNLGAQQFGQQAQALGLQGQFGGQQQQAIQSMLDRGYADYAAAQNYPYQQLGFMSDILRGTQGTTRSMYEPAASPMQTLAGIGTAAYGLSGGRGFAKGGAVSEGQGIEALANQMRYLPASTLEQKARAAQNNDLKGFLAAKIAEQEQQQIRAGAMNQQALNAPPPQGTVVQADLANSGIAAAAPESVGQFADGGIVSFADGGGLAQYEQPYATLSDAEAAEVQRRAREEMLSWPGRAMGVIGRGWDKLTEGTAIADQRAKEAAAKAPVGLQAALRRQDPVAPVTTPNPFAERVGTAPPTPDAGAKAPPAPTRAPAAPGITALPGVDVDKAYAPAEQAVREWGKAKEAGYDTKLSDYEKMMSEFGLAGADKETRIKERQKELEGRGDKAKSNAFVQAGLAILAADPKKGLAAAIGTGGQAGMAAYEKQAEKLQAEKDKLNDSLDNLMDLRRQEAMATGKDKLAYKNAKADVAADVNQQLAALTGKKAETGIEAALKLAEMRQRMEIAKMQQAGELERTKMLASARGATGQGALYDKAVDNAQKRIDALVKNNPALAYDLAKVEALRTRYVQEEMANLGAKTPTSAAGDALLAEADKIIAGGK